MSTSRLIRWLWILFIAFIFLFCAEKFLIKPIIELVASQVIGARTTLGSFSLNILTHQIRIHNLQIFNEEGFPSKVFFSAPEIGVDIDLPAVLHGKLHFPLVIFHLDKMIVFRNAQGQLNVDQLKVVQQKLHDKTKGPVPNFQIDELKLNIEEVIVEDDSKTPALIEAYDLNLKDKTFHHINGVGKLVGVVMVEALKPTAIQSAGVYAATTLLGVGFLPGLAIGIAVAKDDAVSDIPHGSSQVFQQSLELVKRLGKIKRMDQSAGQIFATVYGCDITIKIESRGWNKASIVIKARKYFLPKPEIAAGLLYQLKEELN